MENLPSHVVYQYKLSSYHQETNHAFGKSVNKESSLFLALFVNCWWSNDKVWISRYCSIVISTLLLVCIFLCFLNKQTHN